LTGDTSDNIPGVPRLRRLIAANLSQNLTIDALYASGFPGCSKRERNLIINMRPRIDLNYELVGFRNIDPLDNFKIESTENFEIADEILRKNFNSVIDSSAFKVGSGKKIIISDSLGFLDPV
jgi:5'-3' exonuclease